MGSRAAGWSALIILAGLAVLVSAFPVRAEAAFPGKNGKLAFSSKRAIPGVCDPCEPKIYTMTADGTGVARLDPVNADLQPESAPEWSPGGTQIAYTRGTGAAADVTKINADGTARTSITPGSEPTWSPDGAQVSFVRDDVYRADVDGTGVTALTNDAGCFSEEGDTYCKFYADPSWSPAGTSIAWTVINTSAIIVGPRVVYFSSSRIGGGASAADGGFPDWSPDGSRIAFATDIYDDENPHRAQIAVSAPDGSGRTLLTGPVCASAPAWSPDGSRIAFAAGGDACGGDTEIYVMNADGSNVVQLTSNSYNDEAPSWQPIPVNAYPRPKAAKSISAPLVPAYRQCDPDQATLVHGPPLEHPSCGSPALASGYLTLGTADSNGRPTTSSGYVRITQIGEGPPLDLTNGDQADVTYELELNDVRKAADLSDYTGELQVQVPLRLTDKDNTPSPGPTGAATVTDASISFNAPCTSTATSIGATCSVSTTADALVPGTVKEAKRAVWALGNVRVLDGGADGDAETGPNTLFAAQGLFIP
jgi:Tol biopolymer transport system component